MSIGGNERSRSLLTSTSGVIGGAEVDRTLHIASFHFYPRIGRLENHADLSTSSVVVLTLDRKPSVNPILFAPGIVPHISVSQRRQFTGGVL
jgi:hypothetical protein